MYPDVYPSYSRREVAEVMLPNSRLHLERAAWGFWKDHGPEYRSPRVECQCYHSLAELAS